MSLCPGVSWRYHGGVLGCHYVPRGVLEVSCECPRGVLWVPWGCHGGTPLTGHQSGEGAWGQS